MTPELEALERLKKLFQQRAQTHIAQMSAYKQLKETHEALAAAIHDSLFAVEAEIAKLKEGK